MYRSALVALMSELSNDVLMTYAIDWAQRSSLRLEGIAILDRDLVVPTEPVPLGGMTYKHELDESRMDARREGIRAVLADFVARCEAGGVVQETTYCEDDLGSELARAVQRHDMLILGHAREADGPSESAAVRTLLPILRRNPRPVIVTPTARRMGESVVVAYDGSVQAARALAAFVASGFETGAAVHIMTFQEELSTARETAALAERFLASHGYRATVHAGLHAGSSIAEKVLAACQEFQAKLLVMGSCSKPTLWEFVFGSVTKRLLAEATIPILMDH